MTIRLASAPVSWGIYEFKDIEPKYPYARVLDEIAETGYTGLELGPWGYLPTNAETLRAELASRHLRVLSSFVPVRFADPADIETQEAHALKVGRLLASQGAVAIVLSDDNGTVPGLVQRAGWRGGSILSPDEWDVYAAGVNRVARTVYDATGLRIVFHHHCAGYVETAEETRALMERTDPDLIGLCLDTGHWHYAGGDAVQCIREYGERVRYLHFKDCDPAVKAKAWADRMPYFPATALGLYCELGHGEVDFPAIVSAMNALGYDGWAVVEQDVFVGDLDAPKQSSRRNREYLQTIGL